MSTIGESYKNGYIYKIRYYLHISCYISSFLGFFGNLLLVKILYFLKKKVVGSYRKLLIHIAITDLIFASTIFLVIQVMEPINGYIVSWNFGLIRYLPTFWHIALLSIHINLYYFTVSNNVIIFIYRYNILKLLNKLWITNFFLIWKEMKWILMLTTCPLKKDGYVIQVMEPINGYIVSWNFGLIRYLPTFWHIALLSIHINLYYFTVSNNVIIFIYRYNILVRHVYHIQIN
uniref:G_PROTEIN_RECEP_F1_2 domain-containing protein n=1 Tax=Parastrongyloides trichosuri TaxID=131310 RepID=A0A0N5A6U0_PARTI